MANHSVSSHNRIAQAGRWLGAKVAGLFAELSEFQQRIWVVSIAQGTFSDTFLVNEDSFDEPMQWMIRKGYDAGMVQQVDAMKRSQAIQLDLGGVSHQLLRIK